MPIQCRNHGSEFRLSGAPEPLTVGTTFLRGRMHSHGIPVPPSPICPMPPKGTGAVLPSPCGWGLRAPPSGAALPSTLVWERPHSLCIHLSFQRHPPSAPRLCPAHTPQDKGTDLNSYKHLGCWWPHFRDQMEESGFCCTPGPGGPPAGICLAPPAVSGVFQGPGILSACCDRDPPRQQIGCSRNVAGSGTVMLPLSWRPEATHLIMAAGGREQTEASGEQEATEVQPPSATGGLAPGLPLLGPGPVCLLVPGDVCVLWGPLSL